MTLYFTAPAGIRPLFDRVVPGRTIATCEQAGEPAKGVVERVDLGLCGERLALSVVVGSGISSERWAYPADAYMLTELADEHGRVFWRAGDPERLEEPLRGPDHVWSEREEAAFAEGLRRMRAWAISRMA